MIPKKMREGKFLHLKEKAKGGERVIADFLKKQNYKVLHLDYESPYDKRTDVSQWRELPKIPDGLAKKDDDVFFFEVKTKSFLNLIVNARNYREYISVQRDFFSVRIYFYIESTKAIYVHFVEDKKYPTRKEWDGNMVYNLDDHSVLLHIEERYK